MLKRISESRPELNAEDTETRNRLLLKIQQGLAPTPEEWLWLLTAELALGETRQDRGYDLAP